MITTETTATDEVARLKTELARTQSAAQTLGKIVVGHVRVMEAARIELAQGRLYEASQWILNSLPDVWDDPETKWDGKEPANEWWDRTDAFYRAAEKPVAGSAPMAAEVPPPGACGCSNPQCAGTPCGEGWR